MSTAATSTTPTAPAAPGPDQEAPTISLAVPKGRIGPAVERLLAEAGWAIRGDERDYRPGCEAPSVVVKRLKPQNIPELIEAGRHDLGFTGADWVREREVDIDQVLDLGLDPVRIVAAAPAELGDAWREPGRRIVIATEYVRLAEKWARKAGLDARVLRTHGATEVFPPEDADLIIDNTATGSTLRSHRLDIVDEVLRSSTRLYARTGLRKDAARWARVEDLVLLLRASLDARDRVMLELNVTDESLQNVLAQLPAMRAPTVSQLWGGVGHAVKAAVPRAGAAALIPELRRAGATDIVVYALERLCP